MFNIVVILALATAPDMRPPWQILQAAAADSYLSCWISQCRPSAGMAKAGRAGELLFALPRAAFRQLSGVICEQAQAVELLCRCDDIPDENIELRVLKGLLSTVTSTTIHIHGQALLLVRLTPHSLTRCVLHAQPQAWCHGRGMHAADAFVPMSSSIAPHGACCQMPRQYACHMFE